jgi:hypothetical protein
MSLWQGESLSNYKMLVHSWNIAHGGQPQCPVKGLQSLNVIHDCVERGINLSLALTFCLQPDEHYYQNVLQGC